MPDTTTPNYALWKPEIDAAADYWGQLLNQNFDTIDTLMLQRLNKAAGAGAQVVNNQVQLVAQPGQTVGDMSAATVGWVVSYVATHVSDARIYANQRIADYMNWIFPIYTIIMWRGTAAGPFPPGWSPCIGNVHDGILTPNLMDRFVMGAGPGGAAKRGDSGTYEGNPSWWFEHIHHSQRVYSGPAGNPYMQAMWDNQLDGNPTPQPAIAVPYYTLCFLMKTRNITVADVG